MRKHYIDWLRNLAILLLFPFHTARVFDLYEANYVENAVKSTGLTWFIIVSSPWFMPLLFLISGMSAFYALRKRSGKEFASERVKRLLIPFILGIILIVPLQGYFARLQFGTLKGNYIYYLFHNFFTDFSDISGYRGTFTPAHLWFIGFLFIIALVLLPFMLKVSKTTKLTGTNKLAAIMENPIGLLLMFVPVTLMEAIPDIGGKNIFFYGMIFFIGYIIASSDKITETILKIKYIVLAGTVLLAYPLFSNLFYVYSQPDFSTVAILFAFMRNLWIWCLLLSLIAFSAKLLNFGTPILNWFSKAAFPVYILHQTVLIGVAYFIVKTNMIISLKFTAIMILSFILSVAFYEIFRRIPGFKTVLGIK